MDAKPLFGLIDEMLLFDQVGIHIILDELRLSAIKKSFRIGFSSINQECGDSLNLFFRVFTQLSNADKEIPLRNKATQL